jgi:hypothetical protein
MASVMAMIFLMLIAALAVGFYSSIESGDTVADNEQYVHHSMTASESALNYGRYELTQISLPTGTTQANLLTNVLTALGTNINNTQNFFVSGTTYNNPSAQPNGSGQYVTIPGQPAGWTPASPASGTNWMPVDGLGGQAYLILGQIAGSTNLYLEAVGENTNARVTPVTRKVQLDFSTGVPPVLNYGMVSYGEMFFTNNVTVTGSGGGALVVSNGNPVSVTKSSSFSGDFYYTSGAADTPPPQLAWGSGANQLTVAGFNQNNVANWKLHVHPNTAKPTAPTVDTSGFATYVTAQYGGGPLLATPVVGNNISFASTLTNTELTAASGGNSTYTFSNPVTINGILYIDNNVTGVTFNSTVTVNGCIVQQTPTTGSSCTMQFNNTVNGSSIATLSGTDFPAGERALAGSFLLLPNGTATFNNVTSAGTMLASTLKFNNGANLTVTSGSLVATGSGGIVFNTGVPATAVNINITNATQAPAGIIAGGNYAANSSTYTEVYP